MATEKRMPTDAQIEELNKKAAAARETDEMLEAEFPDLDKAMDENDAEDRASREEIPAEVRAARRARLLKVK